MSKKGFFARICSFFSGSAAEDTTGVERYVRDHLTPLTGVEKYIRAHPTPLTGVELYIRG